MEVTNGPFQLIAVVKNDNATAKEEKSQTTKCYVNGLTLISSFHELFIGDITKVKKYLVYSLNRIINAQFFY